MKEESKPSSTRYAKPTTEPRYNTTSYTEETIMRVGKLEKDGKKGKECLKDHLEEFNKKSNTNFKKLPELDDKALNSLMDYIENLVPKDL